MSTNEPMPQEQLDAIQARVDGATTGPWCHWSGWDQTDNCVSREDMHTVVAEVIPESDDARFIAHAREDIPALLAEVERLRERFTVDEDMVERAAQVMMEASPDSASITDDERDWYTRDARVALNAALNTEEEA